MVSRGPDDAGWIQRQNVRLGHRRLAIRDADNGQQPWISDDGRFALVYNGEIYNDVELKKELEQNGYAFRTSCDTEVLMKAWQHWGRRCVRRLRGMFAFGIVDLKTNQFWLVRDRCGIKPLFFARIENEFVFASSIAAIKRHPRFSARPNLVVMRHYLSTLRLTMDDQTVYENIFSVRPAEIITGTDIDFTRDLYWSLDSFQSEPQSYRNAVEQIDETMQESVELRLRSDVPVGMMLSGGVDSNTIAGMVAKKISKPMVGYCGGGVDSTNQVESDKQSDFYYARECATRLNFEHKAITVDGNQYRDTWQRLVNEYQTPLATPTDVIINHVATSMKQEVGVVLGGEGADEAFCGYTIPHWSGTDFDRSMALGNATSANSDKARESLKRQYGRDLFYSASDHYLLTNGLIPRGSQASMFRDETWVEADGQRAVERYYDGLFDHQGDRPMAEKCKRVLFRLNLESLLGRLDSATMSASLEARVPYTDHRVVEQAFRTPHDFKIDIAPEEKQPWLSSLELASRGSLRSKRVLRSVANRWMPHKIAQRPKQSFPTPLPKWLDHDWKLWSTDLLKKSDFANSIFRRDSLEALAELPPHLSMWKWPVINIAMWGDRVFG